MVGIVGIDPVGQFRVLASFHVYSGLVHPSKVAIQLLSAVCIVLPAGIVHPPPFIHVPLEEPRPNSVALLRKERTTHQQKETHQPKATRAAKRGKHAHMRKTFQPSPSSAITRQTGPRDVLYWGQSVKIWNGAILFKLPMLFSSSFSSCSMRATSRAS